MDETAGTACGVLCGMSRAKGLDDVAETFQGQYGVVWRLKDNAGTVWVD